MCFYQMAQQSFTVSLAIAPSGIKKIDPSLYGQVQLLHRLDVVGGLPTAHAPHAIANFTQLPIGSSKSSVDHNRLYKLYFDAFSRREVKSPIDPDRLWV